MKQDRITQIKHILMRDSKVINTELCTLLGVSLATIRRDLDQLEREGIITRFYGGARLADSPASSHVDNQIPRWSSRMSSNVAEKRAIAQVIASLLPNNCTVYLDSGTTLYEIAKMLVHRSDITIVTNSLHTAVMLGAYPNLQVYCVGGNVKYDMVATAGVIASSSLSFFPNIDICILSADSFIPDLGMREYSMETAILKKNILDRSQKSIVALDHTKFSITATSPVCRAKDVNVLVTDSQTPIETIEQLRAIGINVIIANTDTTE